MKIKFAPHSFETAKKSKKISLRLAQPTDAKEILSFAVGMAKTSKYILSTPADFKKMTVAEEKQWIESFKDGENKILIVAVDKKKIVGILDFVCFRAERMRHVGRFGVSVSKTHQGLGIGKELLSSLLVWASQQPHIKKIELEVVRENYPAVLLYEKMGFTTEGVRKGVMKIDKKYLDLLVMARNF